MPPKIQWRWCRFDELSPREIYAALRARSDVFVMEQKCVFLDPDDADQDAWHLLGFAQHDGTPALAAYLRVLAPGTRFAEASIGRVLTTLPFRRAGAGRALMHEGVRRAEATHPGHDIRIGAQRYLEAFYAGFGFVPASEPYLEDGIEHIEMLRPARA